MPLALLLPSYFACLLLPGLLVVFSQAYFCWCLLPSCSSVLVSPLVTEFVWRAIGIQEERTILLPLRSSSTRVKNCLPTREDLTLAFLVGLDNEVQEATTR